MNKNLKHYLLSKYTIISISYLYIVIIINLTKIAKFLCYAHATSLSWLK